MQSFIISRDYESMKEHFMTVWKRRFETISVPYSTTLLPMELCKRTCDQCQRK